MEYEPVFSKEFLIRPGLVLGGPGGVLTAKTFLSAQGQCLADQGEGCCLGGQPEGAAKLRGVSQPLTSHISGSLLQSPGQSNQLVVISGGNQFVGQAQSFNLY